MIQWSRHYPHIHIGKATESVLAYKYTACFGNKIKLRVCITGKKLGYEISVFFFVFLKILKINIRSEINRTTAKRKGIYMK